MLQYAVLRADEFLRSQSNQSRFFMNYLILISEHVYNVIINFLYSLFHSLAFKRLIPK